MIYDKEESIIRNLLTFKSATYQKVYEDSICWGTKVRAPGISCNTRPEKMHGEFF